MDEPNYELENLKEHINIGVILFWDNDKEEYFAATCELFGNGYDITVYDNNEFQYIIRGVTSNPTYELIKYTDDGKVVARVNDEIFIFEEQQFELIKHHYESLNNKTQDDTTPNENFQYFSEDDEAYFVYEALLEEPQNIRLRVKLIAVLSDEITYFERSKTYGDLLKYISLMEENLQYLLSINSRKDKRLYFTQILCLSQLGMLSAYKGEIDNAIKYWFKAVENATQSSARENYTFKNIIGANVLNILCFLNFLGEESIADKLRLKLSKEMSFYIKTITSIKERVYKNFENSVNSTDPLKKEFHLKENAFVQTLTKNKNNDVFCWIEFDSDDYEAFFCEAGAAEDDDYNAAYFSLKSISGELTNGTYSAIFEKDASERKRQLMRIKAYL